MLARPEGRLGRALLLSFFLAAPASAEEYSLDLSAYEKQSPFELGGYAELKFEHQSLAPAHPLYRLNFAADPRDMVERGTATLELTGTYRSGSSRVSGTWHGFRQHDYQGETGEGRFYELYLAHQPDPATTLELGKRALKWGKGYAWNPVAFLERPKDPLDPELSREGFVIAGGDFIRSREGDLQTLAFTPVLLPVSDDVNPDFGPERTLNAAAKLYLLYRDVDIDLLYLSDGSRGQRLGADFSANLASNLEVHGEFAHVADHEQRLYSPGGAVTRRFDAHVWLLGLRHLSERDTTTILEFYHDGRGYTRAQMAEYLDRVASAPAGDLPALRALGQAGYTRANALRDYLYLRVMQKEPFDLLYWTPALTVLYNADDHSWSATPELAYTGIDNLELRLRATFLHGGRLSEYGAKANDGKLEIRLRYAF